MQKKINEIFDRAIFPYRVIGKFHVKKLECRMNDFPSIYELWAEYIYTKMSFGAGLNNDNSNKYVAGKFLFNENVQ